MKERFVFFHVGEDLSFPRMLVKSIHTSNPGAEVIQCTDLITPKVDGVYRCHRIDGNRDNLMTFRLAAFSALQLDQTAIYLDTDMLVVKPFSPTSLLGRHDVMLCLREFDRESPHSGSQRGVHFPEHQNRPLGEVYPYLACATIARNSNIWRDLLEILHTLDDRFHRWYGDQEAMKIWAGQQEKDVAGLPESRFACLPEQREYIKESLILHFKGSSRKRAMVTFFNSLCVELDTEVKQPEAKLNEPEMISVKAEDIRYVIMTPPPNPKSAGISYLNDLAEYLRALGKHVIQLFTIYPQEQLHIWGSTEIPTQNHWAQPWQGEWIKIGPGDLSKTLDPRCSIVIHGENQHFKWYEGLNVVRYYLHTIGGLQKKGVPRDGEFKVAWLPMFCPDADYFLRKSMVRIDLDAAEDLAVDGRSLDLSYVGKAWLHDKGASRLPNTIELTRSWPTNDDEYFYLLSNARCLFTYDANTSVLDDAIILGAMPVIMSTAPFSREQWRAKLPPETHGCYCFAGEDLEASFPTFRERRKVFIAAAKEQNASYFKNLDEFCRRVESRFFDKIHGSG